MTPHSGSVLDRTPEDVWRLIFLELFGQVAEEDPAVGYTSSCEEAVAVICRVCRLWLYIAHQTPGLWRRVTFHGPKSELDKDSLARFTTHITRSGVHTVQLYIDITALPKTVPPVGISRVTSAIIPYLHRIDALKIRAKTSLPPSSRLFFDVNRQHTLPGESPWPSVGLPWATLTILELDGVLLKSLDDALLLLGKCHQLRKLRITGVQEKMELPSDMSLRVIGFPCLHDAEFEVGVLDGLLPTGLYTPILHDLVIINDFSGMHEEHTEVMHNFVFAHSVRSLSLKGYFSDDFVLRCLGCTPMLRYMALDRCEAGDYLLGLDLPVTGGRWFARELEILKIVDGSFGDEAGLRLIDAWCVSSGASKSITLHVSGCRRTTEKLGQELVRQGRGTWASIAQIE